MVNLVGNREELQAESHLDKAENYLYRVQPTATLWQLLQHRREESKEGEWQGKGCGECQHCNDWRPHLARGRFDKYRAYDWACARERYEHQGQCHKEDAAESALIRLCVALVYECAWKGNLECTEERCRKDHKYHKEDDIWYPMCSQPVEDVGCYGITTQYTRNNNKYSDRECVESNDK